VVELSSARRGWILNRRGLLSFITGVTLFTVLFPIALIQVTDSAFIYARHIVPLFAVPFVYKVLVQRYWPFVLAVGTVFLISLFHGAGIVSAAQLPFLMFLFSAMSALFYSHIQRAGHFRVVRFFVVLAVLTQAGAIFLFVVAPAIENWYLKSPLAVMIFGADFGGNALGERKIGGILFVNGNWAATFSMTLACLSMIVFGGSARWLLAGLFVLSVVLTGSKSPVMLFPITGVFIISMVFMTKVTSVQKRLFLVMFLGMFFTGAVLVVPHVMEMLGEVQTFSYRLHFWEIAASHWSEYLLWGGGPQYWIGIFLNSKETLWWNEGVPVHNSILHMLMVSGIVPVLLILAFLGGLMRAGMRCIGSDDILARRIGVWGSFGIFWVFLHSQVSNMSMVGDATTMVVTALLSAMIFRWSEKGEP